ncbi:P-loop containing nucleoside triphosphate hydrolase protein [Mycena galopus ATCC 62051]|nr:P-loop containing nucleoside triphosphate hydrolase protein [Mycena galopus ATCC 62051]
MVPRQASLEKAIEIVQQAIEHDKAQNHSQACKEYMDALDYFMLALKYEKNEQFKLLIRSKIDDYLSRAEILKAHLSAPAVGVGVGGVKRQVSSADDKDPETKKLRAGLAEAILGPAGSDVTWDDIAGLDAAKSSLKEAALEGDPALRPPGTGKSYLAKAVATEAKSTFFSISSSDLVSKWQGDSEKLVKHLFQMAREMKPAIIFIDEIDSLTGARGDGDSDALRRIKTELLVQMDGVGHDDTGVLVIGATNIPWQMDVSIKRRFQKRIYIPLPGLDARQRMFELHVGETPCELTRVDYHVLATKTEGYSGADIQIIVQDALMQPIRKFISATHFKPVPSASGDGTLKWMSCSPGDAEAVEKSWSELAPDELFEPAITLSDFTAALESVRPSVVESDITRHVQWTKDFGSDGS